jgi:hypothetical protein
MIFALIACTSILNAQKITELHGLEKLKSIRVNHYLGKESDTLFIIGYAFLYII